MKTRNKKPNPVSQGDFVDGPDTLLWNPTIEEVPYRRKTVRAFATDNTLLVVLFGAGSVVLGIAWATGGAATLLLAVGVIAVVFGVFAVAGDFSTSSDDYRLAVWGRQQKQPGEFFYRTNDFADIGSSTQDTVVLLVDAIAELTATPARDWLDPALPREAHQVVWDTLSCLDRTRPARALAARFARQPSAAAAELASSAGGLARQPSAAAAELASSAAAAVEAIDTAVAEVVFHLQGCLTLTRAWETKLHHRDLVARADTVLAALREIPLASVVETAESLPRSVFAYLTAARDVTGTGPFPWEAPEVIGVRMCWRTVRPPAPERDRHHSTAPDTES